MSSIALYWGRRLSALRLTRRNEGVLDCIAFEVFLQYIVCTLDEVSIQRLQIVDSSDCYYVYCHIPNCEHCIREGLFKNYTTLRCPIVYPVWRRYWYNITVSTDEGELV